MLRRIFKEPLFHFLLLGGGIFLLNAAVGEPPQNDAPDTIIISDTDLEVMRGQFQATWRRPPTADEEAKLLDAMLREEILVREALALGMEQNDTVIRRRLVQKMEFFAASAVEAIDPDEETLVAFYTENQDAYRRSPRVALSQIFLGPAPSDDDVAKLRAALAQGDAPETLGQRTLLPPRLPMTAAPSIDGTFGNGFTATLLDLPAGEWAGPVRSGYGYHLVRVDEVERGELPALDALRDIVLQDWRRARQEDLLKNRYESLRDSYDIILPEDAKG